MVKVNSLLEKVKKYKQQIIIAGLIVIVLLLLAKYFGYF